MHYLCWLAPGPQFRSSRHGRWVQARKLPSWVVMRWLRFSDTMRWLRLITRLQERGSATCATDPPPTTPHTPTHSVLHAVSNNIAGLVGFTYAGASMTGCVRCGWLTRDPGPCRGYRRRTLCGCASQRYSLHHLCQIRRQSKLLPACRVGNALGAGKPGRARLAAAAALVSWPLVWAGVALLLVLPPSQRLLIRAFTDGSDQELVTRMRHLLYLLVFLELFDGGQMGGCGWCLPRFGWFCPPGPAASLSSGPALDTSTHLCGLVVSSQPVERSEPDIIASPAFRCPCAVLTGIVIGAGKQAHGVSA